MNSTISTNGLPVLPQAKTSTGSSSDRTNTAVATDSAAVKTNDSVSLTDSARALQQASSTTTQSPVDTARVDKIRQSLANGSYQVDAGKIASSLVSLESQISGKP